MPHGIASLRDDIDQKWVMPSVAVPVQATVSSLTIRTGDRSFRICVSPELGAFAAEWPRSGQRGQARCHVFQHRDIIALWLSTIGTARHTQPQFIGVFDEQDEPVMLLAFGIERRRGLRILSFLDETVSDYNQPVLFPPVTRLTPPAIRAIWQGIVRALPRFDVAILDKMSEATDDLRNPLLHLGAQRSQASGHVMRLETSLEALEKRLPRKKVRTRHRKQLDALGSVEFRVAKTRDEARAILTVLVEQKSRQFAETNVPGFEAAGKEAFFQQSIDRLTFLEPLHVSALTVDGTIIACHWGLITEERFYMLMTAYADEPWRRYSPGALLHDILIRWSQTNGLAWFDFGYGDEAYKAEYCDTVLPLYHLAIPMTLSGRAYLTGGHILDRLRATRAWQAARPLKWRLIRAFQSRTAGDSRA